MNWPRWFPWSIRHRRRRSLRRWTPQGYLIAFRSETDTEIAGIGNAFNGSSKTGWIGIVVTGDAHALRVERIFGDLDALLRNMGMARMFRCTNHATRLR